MLNFAITEFSEVRRSVSRAAYGTSKWVEEPLETMPDETSHLPPGYSLDLVGDPCIIILRRPDGAVVARFSRNVNPKEIRQAAEDDRARVEVESDG
jgi:hypothetical protein